MGSGRRGDCGILLPSARAQNFVDLRQSKVALFLAIVEVRGKAHACFGPVIDKDVPSEQLAADFRSMGTIDGYCACAFRGFLRRVDAPSAGLRVFQEPGGPAER